MYPSGENSLKYEEGKQSFLSGLPSTSNPYRLDCSNYYYHYEWLRGWIEEKQKEVVRIGIPYITVSC